MATQQSSRPLLGTLDIAAPLSCAYLNLTLDNRGLGSSRVQFFYFIKKSFFSLYFQIHGKISKKLVIKLKKEIQNKEIQKPKKRIKENT